MSIASQFDSRKLLCSKNTNASLAISPKLRGKCEEDVMLVQYNQKHGSIEMKRKRSRILIANIEAHSTMSEGSSFRVDNWKRIIAIDDHFELKLPN